MHIVVPCVAALLLVYGLPSALVTLIVASLLVDSPRAQETLSVLLAMGKQYVNSVEIANQQQQQPKRRRTANPWQRLSVDFDQLLQSWKAKYTSEAN